MSVEAPPAGANEGPRPPGGERRAAPFGGEAFGAARAAGVTLIELLVVLSIMAVAAGIVVPMLRADVSNSELKAAARQVAAGLRVARSEALATRSETRVVLNLEQRTFQVDRDVRVHPLPRRIELKLFTAQSDLVDEKVGAIRFFPDGGSNGGRVTLAAGPVHYDVDVDWLTGRVAIAD
jgi:general secretion pathway protein H